jgi:hypothetical protein
VCPVLKTLDNKVEGRTCERDKGPCSRNGKLVPELQYDTEGKLLPEKWLVRRALEIGGIVPKLWWSRATGSGSG